MTEGDEVPTDVCSDRTSAGADPDENGEGDNGWAGDAILVGVSDGCTFEVEGATDVDSDDAEVVDEVAGGLLI